MRHLQPAYTLVANQVPESESATGRFDPENSERTVCLDNGPLDGIRLRHFVDVNGVLVMNGDGGVSVRFERRFVPGYEGGGLDEVGVGGVASRDSPSVWLSDALRGRGT
jgi:hypothetical protein